MATINHHHVVFIPETADNIHVFGVESAHSRAYMEEGARVCDGEARVLYSAVQACNDLEDALVASFAELLPTTVEQFVKDVQAARKAAGIPWVEVAHTNTLPSNPLIAWQYDEEWAVWRRAR